MKRITKSLLLSTCFLFGLATFTHATKLSKLLEDEDLFRICELGEKILLNYYEYDLTIIQHCNISNYCKSFLHHNDRELSECCEMLYTIKALKDVPLSEEEVVNLRVSFISCLLYIYHNCLPTLSMTYFGLTQEEHDSIANLDLWELIRKIRHSNSSKFTDTQPSSPLTSQQAPKKSSCTIL